MRVQKKKAFAYKTSNSLHNSVFSTLSLPISRAGHCICREYHNPDEHEHDEDESYISTCSSLDGGKLVKKIRKASGVDKA